MDKVKLTQEQALELKKHKKNLSFESLIKKKIGSWNHLENNCLNSLSLKDFTKALINGYEIELPPAPKLKTKKIDVSYNVDFGSLNSDNDNNIYLGLYGMDCCHDCMSFSFEEAREIATTLNALIEYYENHVNQKS